MYILKKNLTKKQTVASFRWLVK